MQSPRYLRLAARYWPFTLVLSSGLMLGYFLVRTYVAPLPRQYQLNFGRASWIEPPAFSPVAYFRKTIFLSAPPEQAWLQVAATDAYILTINGQKIGLENFLKTRVAGIYDLKTHLIAGTNVVGIEVNRLSYPGSAQVLVNGAIKQPGHESVPIFSDARWRVTPGTGIVQGLEPWNSPLVEDETWPSARVVSFDTAPTINWISTNPLLLHLPSTGNWLLAPDAPREAIFSTSFEARRSDQETWIQVASSGELDLLINGKLVTSIPTPPLRAQPPRLNPVTVLPPKNTEQEPSSDLSTSNAPLPQPFSMDAYDITQWIRAGSNRIIAAVRSTQQPAAFIGEGFTILKNGNVQRFQTDSSWQVLQIASGAQPAEPQHAIEAGENGSAPYGYLREGFVKQPRLTDFDTIVEGSVVILAALLLVIAAWLIASWAAAVITKHNLRVSLIRDALFHAPITIGLLFILLLTYDYRFSNDWAFRPTMCFGAIVALAAVRLLHFLASGRSRAYSRFSAMMAKFPRDREMLPYLLLVLIMIMGWAFRYHHLGYMSLDHDEMGQIEKSKGVFVRGYPYYEYAGGVIRPATTYELVPYVLALSGRLFGYSEWSMRFPSSLFGTLTIGIVAIMGKRLFNWHTGLITAFIYACMAVDIRWAQNAFYVQQSQFFSMLTFWFFYEAIRFRPLQHKYLTAASIAFCFAFLSWEGNGFTLPALFLGLVVIRWGEWWWLKDWHLYRCLFFVGALVVAQFCWRTLLASAPYLSVGSGLSNIAGPSLFFLNYAYQPTYYINKLLLDENHVFFTIMILVGLPFCWRHRGFRYVVVLLFSLVFLYTNFLAAVSQRYSYFFQPLVLLGGVAAAVILWDRLLAIAGQREGSQITHAVAYASGLALLLLLFIQSNDWLIKAYSLSAEGNAPGLMSRMNTYRYDYRAAARFVKSHYQPGDIVIPEVSHVFDFYSGMQGDYYIDTLLAKKVTYTDKLEQPVFIEKFRGNPTIRDLTELRDVIHRSRRTWIVFVPYSSLSKLAGPEIVDYLNQNAKAVFESYRAKVFLVEGATQPGLVQSPSH